MLKTEVINLSETIPEAEPEPEPELTPEPEPEPEPEANLAAIEEAVTTAAPEPKKRGRPTGAKSKVQGKPRAPRKKKVTIETQPVQEEIATDTIRIEDESLPRVLPGSEAIPRFSHDASSELMLQLLTRQAQQRNNRKIERWKSMFM